MAVTKVKKPTGRAKTYLERSKIDDDLYKKGFFAYTHERNGKLYTFLPDGTEAELDRETMRPINEKKEEKPKVTAKAAQKAAVKATKPKA